MQEKTDDLKEYFLKQIRAFDIEGLTDLKKILQAFFQKRGIGITAEEMTNLSQQDTLITEESFDCIVGNLPYIRYQHLPSETRRFLKLNYESCQKGNFDIYYVFIEFAQKHAIRSALITPNSWLYTKSGTALRKLVEDELDFIKEYKTEHVFENADVFAAILFLDKKKTKAKMLKIKEEGFKKIEVKKYTRPSLR